jgi:hypothetical protein
VLAEDQPGALFSVAGTEADDVWVVGTERGDDEGPTILHFDGEQWETHDAGVDAGDLFWVHVFHEDSVYAGGTGGLVLHFDGDEFERLETPEQRDVWGVWGASEDDLWVVGGDANLGTGFIWRDQGDGFEVVELGSDLPSPSAWYKVWGTAADDVWFCGVDGALLHHDGEELAEVDSGTPRTLLTVHGTGDGSLVTIVGGQFSATVVESENGEGFEDVTPDGPPLQTFGVFHRDEEAYAVGMQATILRRDGSIWVEQTEEVDTREDLHSVWIDPDGVFGRDLLKAHYQGQH